MYLRSEIVLTLIFGGPKNGEQTIISFGFVFVQAFRDKLPWRIAVPFAINLVAKPLFMPIFTGLRNVPLTAVDIVIVWATILCCMAVVWPCL